MHIRLITPAPPRSRKGNRVTAVRWARILRNLGHRVTVDQTYGGAPCDLLIALHARRSHDAVQRFSRIHPDRPLLVALTGTDLYGDIHTHASARESLEMASRLILLQSAGVDELPARFRKKALVIHQSVKPLQVNRAKTRRWFDVCVIGHLRSVKDPFRTAMAARRLPADSKVRVTHLGAALSPSMEKRARAEQDRNPRYRWLGDVPHHRAMRILGRS